MAFRTISISAAVLAAFCAAGSASGADLRYATSHPVVNAVYADAVLPFVERVAEATDGEVNIRTYPNGQLASAQGALDALRDGTADATLIVALWMPSELSYINTLAQVLFTGSDPIAITGATAETILLNCPQCQEEMAENDAMSLAPYATSPYFTMCNRGIESSDDFQGARFRIGGGAQSALLEELGATRVIVTAPEISESMSRGQIDCAIAPLTFLQSYSVGDATEHVIDFPMGNFRGVDAFAFRKSSWDALDEENRQAILREVPRLVADAAINGFVQEMKESRAYAEELGIRMAQADDALKEAVAQATSREGEIVLQEARARGIEDFEEILEAHQEAVEKWEGLSEEIGTDPDKLAEALWREVYSKL